ncbi:MAG: heat-inducible transcription repressor HrcA [Acholeplasmataceae bacterium]|jgi:heat-inducible transcriptional repressor|nr:heat-inducible transcription repressor HrcA [Acholeplasmataceae bacterium]
MLSNRQKLILKAIVEIYVETGIPVGSKALTNWPYLDYSSATLRYDMQMLEELGFLEKTHSSSGRLPSTKGYRYYLENLVTRDSQINQLFPMIDKVFEQFENSKDLAVKSAIDLLSELTNYTSVVLGPDGGLTRIKKVDIIELSSDEIVILIVTNKGHVQSQVFRLPEGVSKQYLRNTIKSLDDLLRNQYLKDANRILNASFVKKDVIEYIDYHEKIVNAFVRAFKRMSKDDIYLSGIGNMIAKTDIEDPGELRDLMRVLDNKDLLRIIGRTNRLSFRIGREAEFMPTDQCTIISVPYVVSEDEIGTIAIIGPTRMDYAKVIPLMEYIAKNITKLYKK